MDSEKILNSLVFFASLLLFNKKEILPLHLYDSEDIVYQSPLKHPNQKDVSGTREKSDHRITVSTDHLYPFHPYSKKKRNRNACQL